VQRLELVARRVELADLEDDVLDLRQLLARALLDLEVVVLLLDLDREGLDLLLLALLATSRRRLRRARARVGGQRG